MPNESAIVRESFSAKEAARLAGITLTTVNHLCRHDIVAPSIKQSRGHGRRRQYSFGDLVALRLVGQLSRAGVSPIRLRKALVGLRKYHPEIKLKSLPANRLVTNGTEIFLRKNDGGVERAGDGQSAFSFVVDLVKLRDELAVELRKSKLA